MKKLFLVGMLIAALQHQWAFANVGSIDAGLSTQTVIGVPGFNYDSRMGFALGASTGAKLFEKLIPYAQVSFQPFILRTQPSVQLTTWGISAGLKLQGDSGFLGIKPGFGFGMGTSILRLSVPNEITFSYRAYYSFQVNPEIEFPTIGGLSAVYSMPVLMIITKNNGMTTLSHLFSLRWNF